MTILVYVDDFIFISKEDCIIQKCINSTKDAPEGFEFMEEGTINAYISVYIYQLHYRKVFTLYQPLLIDRIIQKVQQTIL